MQLNIEKTIQQKLNDLDITFLVRDAVNTIVKNETQIVIGKILERETEKIITENIKYYLKDSVSINDGWGAIKTFATFEEMFKQELKKKMDNEYKIKKVIENIIDNKVSELMKSRYDEVKDKIVNELVGE